MSERKSIDSGRELGYDFHDVGDRGEPGRGQLDINIPRRPTELHFDPEQVAFPVMAVDGTVQRMTVTHPWRGPRESRLCAGRIVLRDRKGKVVEAYSFGGTLWLDSDATRTCCHVESPVPILRLTGPLDAEGDSTSMDTMLVEEFEAVLAKCRVHWGRDDVGFDRTLASISPDILYAAALGAIDTRLQAVPGRFHDDSYLQTAYRVRSMIRTMQAGGQLPKTLPCLDDLI
jgi:hypothetical protein